MTKYKNININNSKELIARIFSKILYKTHFNKKQKNQDLLGIDLLKTDIQNDLLSISALTVEEIYNKLLEKGNPQEFMQKKGKFLFLQCIKKSCEDFLTKRYGYKVRVDIRILKKSLYTKKSFTRR
jgi:hypothetical protein